ncbi:MAG: hypothetical protein ACI9OJ_004665 [Myxococcota bacterium]|jgi:hypothetical protein
MSQSLAERIVGSWKLVNAEVTFSDGRPAAQPFGPDATGRIIYSPNGRMSAVLMAGPRAGFSGSLETSGRASTEEKAGAFDTYLSYSGRFHIEDDTVVHTVDMALVPAVIGHELRRRATLSADRLKLSYERMPPSGVTRHFVLDWQREPPT